MQREYSLRPVGILFAVLGAALAATSALAQQPGPDSALPHPRLTSILPSGGKVGATVEVSFFGADLEEPEALRFSHPGIKAEAIQPPAPPPPDPKNPPKTPPAKPPVTKFKVTVGPDVPLGFHDVRLVNRWGVSNPRTFVVGDLNEVLEKEPNNDVNQAQRVELNTTINGEINQPTDVDYFVFAGKKGQRVLLSCLTTSIDSRLEAALELYDAKNRQLAFGRMYQNGDALVDCTLPVDGDYYVRLCHFTYQFQQMVPPNNNAHFYRLSITTGPWIDAVFPTVVEPGKPAQLTLYGRNLPGGRPDPSAISQGRVLDKLTVTVNVPADPQVLQRLDSRGRLDPLTGVLDGFEYRLRTAAGSSNGVLLTYARASVVLDNGANDTPETAQEITVPCEIAGRIEKRHDRDYYTFTAKKGEVYYVELRSEHLGASADVKFVLRNLAAKQDVVSTLEQDNQDVFNPKFFLRSADPPAYRFTVPADGKYELLVRAVGGDGQAGPRQVYTVRITPELPDFQLIVMPPANHTPDAGVVPAGGSEALTVFAWRQDGWNGEIALNVEGLPKGVTCPQQVLGAGQNNQPLRLTDLVFTAAADAPAWTGEIKVKGTAVIKGQKVVREARPASITWGVPPQQNVPTITRLERQLVMAVREAAPFSATVTIDKAVLLQGDKAKLTVKLKRHDAEFKAPVSVQVFDLPPTVIAINNNQPIQLQPSNKDEGTLNVDVKAAALPGTYNLVLRATAQVPFHKDSKNKQKQQINVVLPTTPVSVTVLPKSVGTVAVTVPNANLKPGAQTEVVVKVTRQANYAGEFKVQLVLPANMKGLSAGEAIIPAGKDEVKLVLHAAADAAPGPRPDLVVKAAATIHENVTLTSETKFSVTIVK